MDHVYVYRHRTFCFLSAERIAGGNESGGNLSLFYNDRITYRCVDFIVAALISAAICSPGADLNSMAAQQLLSGAKLIVVIAGVLSVIIGAKLFE